MPANANESDDPRPAEGSGPKVQAALKLADGTSHPAAVLELAQGMLVLEFGDNPGLAVALGDTAQVTLTGDCLETPLLVMARVAARSCGNGSTVLQLAALDPQALRGSPACRRRQSVRVAPKPETKQAAELRAVGELERVSARVLDLSRSGLRVELGLLDEGSIASCKVVNVQLQLPDEPEPLRFMAEIRSRTLRGENVQCGLRILFEKTQAREEVERRLTRYVMARQVEGVLERKRPKAS